ncbi:S-adenosyl-L-methionine-dependent methyltransferase [Phlegmacium glaucopus]|nr:S-adenosyl-L-methionine-dependent methyltransferase [Phlegmacium glaucopus]
MLMDYCEWTVSMFKHTSTQLEELRPDEYPHYFFEHDGRLFPSIASLTPYPFPVDTPEQDRQDLIHQMLKQAIGANYVGPVLDVLAPETGRQKMVLDLCAGKGKWVMEMAEEFPRVHFRGIDIVPIATQYPLPKVQFEVQDVNTNYRWREGTFDLVHARSVSMAVRDYPSILQEVARVLCPGGLFISCEWSGSTTFHPSYQQVLSVDAPATVRFLDAYTNALNSCRHLRQIAPQIPTFVANSGYFTDITVEERYIPVGVWPLDVASQNIGADCLKMHRIHADSVKHLFLADGWSEAALERLITDYIQEINTVSGLVDVLHIVHARRL